MASGARSGEPVQSRVSAGFPGPAFHRGAQSELGCGFDLEEGLHCPMGLERRGESPEARSVGPSVDDHGSPGLLNLGWNFAGLGAGRWLRRLCSTLFTGTCRSEGKPEVAFPEGEVRVRRGGRRAWLGPREAGRVGEVGGGPGCTRGDNPWSQRLSAF